jgi:hypothetical protein
LSGVHAADIEFLVNGTHAHPGVSLTLVREPFDSAFVTGIVVDANRMELTVTGPGLSDAHAAFGFGR